VLATSREALHVRGEQEFPLAPLALPDLVTLGHAVPATLLQYPGVALFVQRAQASLPSFALMAQNAAAVADLCVHLDGLPLAIELAAARIKLLPPQAMLAHVRLGARAGGSLLDYLNSGPRDAPPRQRALRSTIQWSYDLLDASEQRAFRCLSVFAGGCTLDAANVVITADGGPQATLDEQPPVASGKRPTVSSQSASAALPSQEGVVHRPLSAVDMIASLVDKNLLRQSEAAGEPRLAMLETIGEFATEMLRHAGEAEDAQRAHAAYYLVWAEKAAQGLAGTEQRTWLERIDREHDNLRAALSWVLQRRDAETALRLAGALGRYWFLRGHWSEGRRWMEGSLAMDPAGATYPARWAHLAHEAGRLIRYQGDVDRAQALDEQALAIYRTLNDQSGMLLTLIQLARLANDRARWAEARVRVDETLALLPNVDDTRARAEALFIAGTNALMESDLDAAQPRLQESLRLMRTLGDQAGIAAVLNGLSYAATDRGDFAAAQAYLSESSALAAELSDQRSHTRALFALMRLATRMGDYALARAQFAELFPLLSRMRDISMVWVLAELSLVLLKQGMLRWAVRIAGLSAHWRETLNIPMAVLFRAAIEQVEAAGRAALGEQAFAEAWAHGQRLSPDDVLKIPNPSSPSASSAAELTARELEVLRLLAQDLKAPAIAKRLVVSPRTVHAHLRSIYDKLGVNSRDGAVRYATENGLI
jgi:predicted ATPase/DNA-binding CsgD family transcriptional regulator